MTQIPFQMKYMSKAELADERYRDCVQPLTANDRRRLNGLRGKALYRETAEYMLEHNAKLEQEIISFSMENGQ